MSPLAANSGDFNSTMPDISTNGTTVTGSTSSKFSTKEANKSSKNDVIKKNDTKQRKKNKHNKRKRPSFKSQMLQLYRRSNFTEWLYSRGIGMTDDFGDEGFSLADSEDDCGDKITGERDDENTATKSMDVDTDTSKNTKSIITNTENVEVNSTKSESLKSGVIIVDEEQADSEETKMRGEIMKKLKFKGSDSQFLHALKTNAKLKRKFDKVQKQMFPSEDTSNSISPTSKQDIEFLPNLREQEAYLSSGNSTPTSDTNMESAGEKLKQSATQEKLDPKVEDASKKWLEDASKSVDERKQKGVVDTSNMKNSNKTLGEISNVKSTISLEMSPKPTPKQTVSSPKTEMKQAVLKKVSWNRDFADLKTYDFNGMVSGVKLIQ